MPNANSKKTESGSKTSSNCSKSTRCKSTLVSAIHGDVSAQAINQDLSTRSSLDRSPFDPNAPTRTEREAATRYP